MGPLKVAALNGLSLSRLPMHDEGKDEPENASNDERVRAPSPSALRIMEPICTLYWLTVCVCVCVCFYSLCKIFTIQMNWTFIQSNLQMLVIFLWRSTAGL